MAKYQRFEDLPAWKEAAKLYNQVLDLFELPNVKLTPGFRNQLDRAALSVATYIAGGFERAAMKDLISALDLARASACEVRCMIATVIGRDANAKCRIEFGEIESTATNCSRQLGAWIESLRNPGPGPRQDKQESTKSQSTSGPTGEPGAGPPERQAYGSNARTSAAFRGSGDRRNEPARPRTT